MVWELEEQVARIVGPERVLGGLCFVCANKAGPGHIRQWDYSSIFLAEYISGYKPCEITWRMREIADDFERAGIPIELGEDLPLARWRKLVWNIPFNGLSVVLNATTDELMTDRYARSLVEQLMGEVAIAARSCDRVITDRFIQKMLQDTAKMKPYRTSMKIDYEERRPLEVEAILGNPLRVAQQAGANLPMIAMLYQQPEVSGCPAVRTGRSELPLALPLAPHPTRIQPLTPGFSAARRLAPAPGAGVK